MDSHTEKKLVTKLLLQVYIIQIQKIMVSTPSEGLIKEAT